MGYVLNTECVKDNTKRRAGGLCVLPNEKHEFSAGLASCTEGRAGRLHYRTVQ